MLNLVMSVGSVLLSGAAGVARAPVPLQRELTTELRETNDAAIALLAGLSVHLEAVLHHVREAEFEWSGRGHDPTRSSLEACARELAAFNADVEEIARHAERYQDVARRIDGDVDPFAVSDRAVGDVQDGIVGVAGRIQRLSRSTAN
ncbi:hypothetical protein [Gordonia rhizosphera]|uniref:hypothetical protein n=1 Tax=Gordonia rhizosphera TaxID=83341 RepID=UPI000318FCC0|nr:hypothetical protein [Gordonia rhizosphera]